MENKTILGIDRLDYTKGIELKLKAFQLFLRKFPELLATVVAPHDCDIFTIQTQNIFNISN